MTDAQRQQIKDQVAAGEARHQAREDSTFLDQAGEAAIEAKDRFTAFAREHPLTTVAGGLALGILISGLFPRSPTRRIGTKAAGLAAIGADAVRAYMQQAMDAASDAGRAGAHRLDDLSGTVETAARRLRRDAAHLVENASHDAREARHDVERRVRRRLHRMR